MSKSIFRTDSAKVTEALAGELALQLKGKKLFLFGDLGIGKTTFLRGLAKGLKIKSRIKSPTFVGEHVHKISKQENFMHIDLYRADKISNEMAERLKEAFNNKNITLAAEWSERLPKNFLPKKRAEIKFTELKSGTRKIEIKFQ